MIHLYSWPTPNGQKVQILLEELGAEYKATPVNILRGEQFAPEFLAFSPNNKIPAIVDVDGAGAGQSIGVFESGAVLMYLAEKFERFFPQSRRERTEVLEWLFFQCGSLGPMLGQATHFRRYAADPVEYAIQRYTKEAVRLYGVLERRLAGREWIAAGEYTIADIATYPWTVRFRRQGVNLDDFPNVKAWIDRVSERPAVKRGMDLLKEAAMDTPVDDQARETLFKA
jgi:GSH-dependent disulfide-bond oxidoreductase